MTILAQRATLDDLMRIEGKAELIGGRIVKLMPTGMLPSEVAANIFLSLHLHARQTKVGRAYTDNLGYAIPELPSGRESFSPDASYYSGPLPANRMGYIHGPPTFAVEVRSENDYGDAAEAELAAKRADYFVAGTLVVWDVDPLAETIACYRAANPTQAVLFRQGQNAAAEPAVLGWTMSVADVFATP